MAKKSKHTLFLEEDFDFDLVGICWHQGDYRLAWVLNENLSLSLSKTDESYMVSHKKGAVVSSHSYYSFDDEENGLFYYLIKNKSAKEWLIPEKHQIDYFLVVKNGGIIDVDDLLTHIRTIPNVLTAILVDPYALKSKDNLVF